MSLEARVGPPIAEAEAVHLAHELYGVEASAQALPGEYDDNFHLTGADGREYVLKVMHSARERSFIDMQCQALRHLAQRPREADPGYDLPAASSLSDADAFLQVKPFLRLLALLSGEVRPVPLPGVTPALYSEDGEALEVAPGEELDPDVWIPLAAALALDGEQPVADVRTMESLLAMPITPFEITTSKLASSNGRSVTSAWRTEIRSSSPASWLSHRAV